MLDGLIPIGKEAIEKVPSAQLLARRWGWPEMRRAAKPANKNLVEQCAVFFYLLQQKMVFWLQLFRSCLFVQQYTPPQCFIKKNLYFKFIYFIYLWFIDLFLIFFGWPSSTSRKPTPPPLSLLFLALRTYKSQTPFITSRHREYKRELTTYSFN